MQLEDNIGDILGKGRKAKGLDLAAAAAAAGLPEADYKTLETEGRISSSPRWEPLGTALDLNGKKLAQIQQGWTPAEPDLSLWREFRRITTKSNDLEVHCYLVWDEVSREAALFDTGWEAAPILKLIEENELALRHIFLTHLHEDHVAALEEMRAKFPKAHLHSNSRHAPPQHRNRANDFLHLGSLRLTNRDTPGHAEEGVTYIIGNWPEDMPHLAIVGDAIFAGSIGTGNQSWEIARQKVREQILTLPDETLLCPGHGPMTTVAEEKAHNPFF